MYMYIYIYYTVYIYINITLYIYIYQFFIGRLVDHQSFCLGNSGSGKQKWQRTTGSPQTWSNEALNWIHFHWSSHFYLLKSARHKWLYTYVYYIYIYYIYICILLESIKYLQKTCRHMDQPPPGPCAWSSREGGPVAWRWLVAWCSCQADRYLPIQSPGEGRELWSYGSLMFLSQGHPRTEFTQWWLGLLEWHSEKQTIFWEKS